MTQGKIERDHRSMKNMVNLQNYFLPGELEAQIANFVSYYNNQWYDESLDNLTPADVYFGRARGYSLNEKKSKSEPCSISVC